MPKRSNNFQRLVTFIYENISPKGGSVTESAMILDKEALIEREVDILLENEIAGHNIRIAIECRARERVDSIEWIDCIIGKTKSLDVDKAVAVSQSGFSESARKKAESNNIDLVTFEEALDIDWSQYMMKPGLAVISGEWFDLKSVLYWKDNEFRNIEELNLQSLVYVDGQEAGTIKECFESLFHKHFIPLAEKYIDEHRAEIFKSLGDLKKVMYLEKEIRFPNLVASANGDNIDISRTKMIALGTRRLHTLETEHALFQDRLITQATHQEENGVSMEFRIINDPSSDEVRINWQKNDRLTKC